MIQAIFDSLEDPKRPFIGPNYWLLKNVGFILPENQINKAIIIILHELISVFVLTQFIEVFMIRSDLDLVISNLRISIVSFICIAKSNSILFYQISWMELIEYITEADKEEREDSNTVSRQIVKSYTKHSRRLTKYYWILLLSTLFCVSGAPLIRYLSSSNYREAVNDGTEPFPHIFSSWVPFDKNSFPGSLITVCLHLTTCVYGAAIMAAYDSVVIVILIFFHGKLKLLREKCKNMFGCNGIGVTDEQAKITLQNLHTIHILLFKYSKLFDSLFSPVMFLYVVMCSLMFCACIFQLTIVASTLQKLLIAQYFIFAIAPVFMFCWYSSQILDQSQQVMMGPYESEWLIMGAKERKNVLILTEQLKLFPVFNAGPFSKLTLSTFVTIMKGAYSFYTLLRK